MLKNLTFIATVLKERWNVGASKEDENSFDCFALIFFAAPKWAAGSDARLYICFVDLDFTDLLHHTLHIAVARKDVAVARFLLKYDADVFMADNNGMTALHIAVAQGSVDLAEMILQKVRRNRWLVAPRGSSRSHCSSFVCIIGNVEVLNTLIRPVRVHP